MSGTLVKKKMAERQEALTPLTNVAVTVILDKSQRTKQYPTAAFLAHAGILTYIDAQHAIAHNTIMLEAPHSASCRGLPRCWWS